MTRNQARAYVRKHYSKLPNRILSRKSGVPISTLEKWASQMGLRKGVTSSKYSPEQVKEDIASLSLKESKRETDKKYKFLIKENDRLRKERDAVKQIATVETYSIKATNPKESESTAVVLASDWHVEERVDPKTINHLNKFNLDIATERAEMFFRNTVRMLDIYGKESKINKLVLALLGDFISGSIHDELMEGNALRPIEALMFAQNLVASGIDYVLGNTKHEILVPCHSGNHGRSTKKQRHATEAGNSFEYYMYHTLANHFRDEPRVKFLISEGYLSYLEIYKTTVRFHHGHNVKYQGGIGGIFIPAFKAISQWNKAHWADLDCFGHFHQFKNGGNFISNGSIIGYNSYAESIKADYERPTQAFFLVNSQYGVEAVTKLRLD